MPTPDRDPSRQRAVVDAFFAAARGGDVDALADPERIGSLDLGFLDDRSG